MKVVTTFEEVRDLDLGDIGLVPTMGFFHEGHLSLIDGACGDGGPVVVSLFINPLQFGAGEDLETYPRDFERDAALAERHHADVMFAPSVEYMYPEPPLTKVIVDRLTAGGEGRFRPGHFTGVATVVAKLFSGVRPARAYMGRKDAQQLSIVRRITRDLSMPVDVKGLPVIREWDGLALSSRNVYLSPEDRHRAAALSTGLFAAADAVEAGERCGADLAAITRRHMVDAGVTPEYVELTGVDGGQSLDSLDRESFMAVAARVGTTRLIDSIWFDVDAGSVAVDRGVVLHDPSLLWER